MIYIEELARVITDVARIENERSEYLAVRKGEVWTNDDHRNWANMMTVLDDANQSLMAMVARLSASQVRDRAAE